MKYFRLQLGLGRSIMAALLLSLLLVPTVAQAQSVDILKIFNEVINQHNPDEVIKYFTDDAVINFPGQPPVQGKAAILAFAKQSGLFAADPTLKVISLRAEGNKVFERTSSIPPQLSQQGENGRLIFESVTEFQGDKIKSFSLVPPPETLQKLGAAQGQGGPPPGAPSAGAGGAAVSASESNNGLTLALLASGLLVVVAAGIALMMSRRSTRH